MKERFEGDGSNNLVEALQRQDFVAGSAEIANALIAEGKLEEFAQGDVLITEGAEDSDVFFLVSGTVGVVVKLNQIATRRAGETVGEMSATEPSLKRSASIIALETVVALRVPSPAFGRIGTEHHKWLPVARTLARRLYQRNELIRAPNESPKLFIISSSEAKPIADEIQTALSHDVFCRIWTDGVFFAGGYPLDALEKAVDESDFAIAVCEPDDIVESRGTRSPTIRDNVLFELGLFMGRLSRARAFLIHPRIKDLKLPSDVQGLTLLSYQPPSKPEDLAAALGPACTAVRKAVRLLGVRKVLD